MQGEGRKTHHQAHFRPLLKDKTSSEKTSHKGFYQGIENNYYESIFFGDTKVMNDDRVTVMTAKISSLNF